MRTMIRSFWRAGFKPFFVNPQWEYRWRAYAGAIVMFTLIIVNVVASVLLSFQLNAFGVALQTGASPDEYHHIAIFIVGIIGIFIATDPTVYSIILPWYMQWWREALMAWYLPLWLQKTGKNEVGSAAQRIKDCSNQIAETLSSISVRSFRYCMGLFGFLPVAWALSENFQFILPIPGLLIWVMIIVCILETALCWYLGRRLPKLEQLWQESDAALRSSLEMLQQRIATNGKTDALMHATKKHIRIWRKRKFKFIRHSIPLLLWQQLYGNFWGYGIQVLLGLFVVVYKIFQYGIMWQTIAVLGEIHRSLSIFSDSWQTLTQLQATVGRIQELEDETHATS